MNPLHSTLRHGILFLVLLCSMGLAAQTEDVIRSNDQPVSLHSSNEEDSISGKEYVGKIYDVVEEQPSFPGGQTALMSWLSKNLHFAHTCDSFHGRVVISFVVEPDGSLSNIQVARKANPEIDEEFIRLVKAMPKWIPGNQNGQAVRVKYNMPLTICMQ